MAIPEQVPGGPPVTACKYLSDTLDLEHIVNQLIKDIKSALAELAKLKMSIMYGGINIADIAGAELVAALGSVASSIAQSALGAVSGAASAILEAILSQILNILLSFPEAIFSLVSLPLKQSVEAAQKERQNLLAAQLDINHVISILSKWADDINGAHFYNQMKSAYPDVSRALELIKQMLSELDTTSQTADNQNAVFNESKYNKLRGLIKQAIDKTKPEPTFNATQQLTKKVTKTIEDRRKTEIFAIENKYRAKREGIDSKYKEKLNAIDQNSTKLSDLVTGPFSIEGLQLKWAAEISSSKSEEKIEIAKVDSSLKFEGLVSYDDIKNTGKSIYESFKSDMHLVANYLYDFLKQIKDASTQNLLCQLYCGTVYKSREIILALIQQMILLIRKTGNVAATQASAALNSAEALVANTQTIFKKQIDQYEGAFKGVSRASSSAMAISVDVGNGLLMTADAVMSGLITDSLMKLINADDILASDSADFNAFLTRLKNIPDWDKARGSWVINQQSGSLSPYLQLIADVTSLTTLLPIYAISKQPGDKEKADNILTNVNNGFNKALYHNGLVLSVVTSYVAYESQECGVLRRMLERLGLLSVFAGALSMTGIIESLQKASTEPTSYSDGIDLYNCRHFYPELFSADGAATFFGDKADALPMIADPSIFTASEKLEDEARMKKALNTIDVNFSNDDLASGAPTPSAFS